MTKRKRGGQPKEHRRDVLLAFRVLPEEADAAYRAASRAGVTLTELLRARVADILDSTSNAGALSPPNRIG